MIGSKRQRDEEPAEPSYKPAPVLIGFRVVYVFDIAQTEGTELPEPATVYGEVGTHHDRLLDFVQQQGIELEYNERIAPAQGVSYGGKIVLLPGQTKAEEFSTLVHELSHEMLHKAERRTMTTKTVRETEAESIGFIVGRAVCLNTGSASVDYISLYHGNAELLTESLAVIQQASAATQSLQAVFRRVIVLARRFRAAFDLEERSRSKTCPVTPYPGIFCRQLLCFDDFTARPHL